MAPVGQVLGRELFSKTKMCKFDRAGKCAKGRQCPWAHDPSELRTVPDLRCTKLCKELISTGRCTKADCSFAHNKEEWRTVPRAGDGVAHKILTNLSQQNPVPAVKISVSKAIDAGQISKVRVPDFVPPVLSADAPGFVPMNFAAAEPAFVPMVSPPPGLQDGQQAYSPSWGYQGYPSFSPADSEFDSSSSHETKIDGDTPISQILALSLAPKARFSNRQISVSTADSLLDLQLSPEDCKFVF
eukprot:TRINITY_DN1484_c0_g3_i1.p1 TRINITY_DN1484_c0_g3~~TRINITY_DN1484_c0_g3_i1.p1  ORF type:complete len:243 (-),score=46.62 TRINITY_DN1484_c0_g3_i1:523-1251(-)